MNIEISGSIHFGPSWDDLQTLVRGMMGDVDGGVFTRIHRRDNGANYRAQYGVYDITYVPGKGDAVEIVLTVNRQS